MNGAWCGCLAGCCAEPRAAAERLEVGAGRVCCVGSCLRRNDGEEASGVRCGSVLLGAAVYLVEGVWRGQAW